MCWQVIERLVLTSVLKTKEPKQQTRVKHCCSQVTSGRTGLSSPLPCVTWHCTYS